MTAELAFMLGIFVGGLLVWAVCWLWVHSTEGVMRSQSTLITQLFEQIDNEDAEAAPEMEPVWSVR